MPEKYKLYLSSLRLERWPRSLAILPGIAAVFFLNSESQPLASLFKIGLLLKIVLAFLLTWGISVANYIINEITDAPFDAFHPQKKDRPLVKQTIRRSSLMTLWLIICCFSFGCGFLFFNLPFTFSLIALFLAGLIYNVPPIRVKDLPYLDSTIESANNPIRFLIGWFVLELSFPPLLLLLAWWAFGNFLMVGKRVAEKKFLTQAESAGYRKSLIRYSSRDLIIFMIVNAVIFIATFSLFAVDSHIFIFLFALPFITIYLAMFMRKSVQDPEGAEEPEKLLKNPAFAIYTLFLVVLFFIAYILR